MTYELISIAYDNDTCIKVTQSKFYTKYKNFGQASDNDKSELRDYMIRYYLNLFKLKGYVCTLNKAEFYKDSIVIGVTLQRGGFTGKMVISSYIKDYVGYNVVALCRESNVVETMNTLRTLKIDGLDFGIWIRQ